MKETFEAMIQGVMDDEGPYSNDKYDDGGPTRYGITYIDLAKYRGIPQRDAYRLVKGMDVDECKAIYKAFYWDPLSCDLLPPGIDYFVFDGGLHSGIGASPKWLQRAVGTTPDGKIGPKTIAAVNTHSPPQLLSDLVARRRAYLKTRPDWKHFSLGWTNRVNKAEKRARKMLLQPLVEPAVA